MKCAYADPSRLGIDRWIAVLAAYHLAPGGACVIDAGTAATFDAVDAHGRHLGGLIMPGPQLLAAALDRNTSNIGATLAARAVPSGLDSARQEHGRRGRQRRDARARRRARSRRGRGGNARSPSARRSISRAATPRLCAAGWKPRSSCGQTWCSKASHCSRTRRRARICSRKGRMRNIFLALVLANLAFAAWHTWFATKPRPTQVEDSSCRRITLVKELPDDIVGAVTSGAAPAEVRRSARSNDAPCDGGSGVAARRRRAAVAQRQRMAGRARRSRRRGRRRGAAGGDALQQRRSVSRARASRDGGGQFAHGGLRADAARRRRRHLDRLLGLYRRARDRGGSQRGSREGARTTASRTRTSFRTATAAISCRSACSARSAA